MELIALYAAAYMLPWIVALMRGHRSHLAIGALTLVGGWSGVLWVVALIWSLTGNVERKPKAKIW